MRSLVIEQVGDSTAVLQVADIDDWHRPMGTGSVPTCREVSSDPRSALYEPVVHVGQLGKIGACSAARFNRLSERAGPVAIRRPRIFSTSCPRQPGRKMKCQLYVTRLECASIGVISIRSWFVIPKGNLTSSVSSRGGRMSSTSNVMRSPPIPRAR